MIRRPPRSTQSRSSAASDVYKRQGYHPDFRFIESLGVQLDPANARCPVCNRKTLESNVPGIYLAGVIVAGERTNEIFIENGRFHGDLIARDLAARFPASGQV